MLIGTIYSMARLAQSSEFTILRTAGLGPGRALSLLGVIGLLFAVLTFSLGEYVTPHSEQAAGFLKARFGMGLAIGRTGAWLKERRTDPDGERSITVNVRGVGKNGELTGVRIFEMDPSGREVRSLVAEHAIVPRTRSTTEWTLQDVTETNWVARTPTSEPRVESKKLPQMTWPTRLNAVRRRGCPAAGAKHGHGRPVALQHAPGRTGAVDAELPHPVLEARAVPVRLPRDGGARPALRLPACARGGVSVKVFGGIMLGISFVLLNNVVGHLGLLHEWTPWIAASVPSVVYLLMSMSAFAWLVRYR